MVVVLLLLTIWVAVLVPPALQAHAARRAAFLVSFGPPPAIGLAPPAPTGSSPVQRRRRILGGLLLAMAVTGVFGLAPPFRVLLVVHLFLVNSFLAYVALLAHLADRRWRTAPASEAPAPVAGWQTGPGPVDRLRRRPLGRPVRLGDMRPVAPAG